MLKQLSVLACGMILLPLSNAVGAESFNVLVMRGSTLVRVTGDENGMTSEVTIREDPTPPAPEIVWESPEVRNDSVKLVIQIFRDAPLVAHGWGFGRAHPEFARHEMSHHGFRRTKDRGERNTTGRFGRGLRSSEWGARKSSGSL